VAHLIAKIEINVSDLESVKNLVREVDMAVQILEGEEGDVAQAVKEGLESALGGLKPKE
jgi:hypothetical protein